MTRAREKSETVRQAKAWVNFDGTFATSPFTEENGGIRNAFNVDSITDVDTGRYTVNFTNDFSNTDYAVCITAGGANNAMWFRTYEDSVARTIGAFHFLTAQFSNGGFIDIPQINLIFFGSSRTNAQNGLYQTPLGIFDQRGKGSLHSTILTSFDQRGEGGLYQTPLAAFDQRGKGVLHSTTLTSFDQRGEGSLHSTSSTLTSFDQRGEGSLHSTSSTLTSFDQRGEGALHSTDADSIP